MKRVDWVEQMWRVIDAHSDQEFQWGKNDCCLFAARVHDAIYGGQYEKTIKEQYHDTKTGLRYLKQVGGLQRAVEEYLGPIKKTGRPKRGDIVLMMNQRREILGVCTGTHITALGKRGLLALPKKDLMGFW